MVTLTIDNRQVTVPEGTLVVEAARQAGIEIPVFCHHPRLEPVGMCRMCLVEIGAPVRDRQTGELQLDEEGKPVIRWFPKLQTGCTTPVSEGMVVRTRTQRVADVRRGILEFLLTSHPLDCPVCDKGGECPLQDLTFIYGPGTSRFEVEDKYHFEKPIPLGPLIVLDRERCILCARCIRFCDEIPDDHVLGFLNRGRGMEVVTFSNPPFGSKFSGNTIDICPVGALTSADFRFKARVWELTNVESICPHCSVGCNLILGVRTHHIKRVIPRENAAVNDIWLCDKGRFGHHFVGSQERLQRPLIRKDGELTPASWDEALDLVAERLGQIRDEAGPDALGGLAGDRCANEDLYLFQKLFRAVIGTNNVDRWPPEAEPDDLVATLGTGRGTNLGAMGPGSAILLLGADLEEEQPVLMLRVKGAAERGAQLIVANGRPTRLDRYASHRLRYRYGSQV
ncbi:MAG: NADH-quinone oxidoreductase subunit NuoG, partial [Anaerolineae bacterium]